MMVKHLEMAVEQQCDNVRIETGPKGRTSERFCSVWEKISIPIPNIEGMIRIDNLKMS